MSSLEKEEFFKSLYREFSSPLTGIDCGKKCGPYNEYGVPVCCDIKVVVPAAFDLEWNYLQENTNLWQRWQGNSDLISDVMDGQILLTCLGYQHCQRPYRTLTCRAFPFYPYLDMAGVFVGMGYYPEFREECWIISNLDLIKQAFKNEFRAAFEKIFEQYPESRQNYLDYSQYIRDQAVQNEEPVIILDFHGNIFKIIPVIGIMEQIRNQDLPAYGPFGIQKELVFPDEE